MDTNIGSFSCRTILSRLSAGHFVLNFGYPQHPENHFLNLIDWTVFNFGLKFDDILNWLLKENWEQLKCLIATYLWMNNFMLRGLGQLLVLESLMHVLLHRNVYSYMYLENIAFLNKPLVVCLHASDWLYYFIFKYETDICSNFDKAVSIVLINYKSYKVGT